MSTQLNISHTQLEVFEDCPRKYSYIYREGIQHTVGVAALFSRDLIHAPLARLYRNPEWSPDWPQVWDAYVAAHGLQVMANQPYTLDVAKACFDQYRERFLAEDCATYDIMPPERMRFFRTELPQGGPILYLSKPDVVFVEKATNLTIPCDFKASRRPSPMLASPFNRQLVGQAMAVGATAFLVNIFTLDATTTGRPRVQIQRHQVSLPQDLCEEWHRETQASAHLLQFCRDNDVWPKHAPKACFSYNQRCEFYDACEAGALRRLLLDKLPRNNKREESRSEE